jgi:hypothetical protein
MQSIGHIQIDKDHIKTIIRFYETDVIKMETIDNLTGRRQSYRIYRDSNHSFLKLDNLFVRIQGIRYYHKDWHLK